MLVRYDIQLDQAGWSVVDRRTGLTAVVDDLASEALDEDEAADIADLLNTLEFLNRATVQH